MTPANWAGLIVSIIAIVSAFAGLVRWLVKHYLNELKPNGGSSMRDEITRLSAQMEIVLELLAKKQGVTMKESKKLLIRLAAVFYVSALATIGAGSLFGVPAATAAGIAGLLAVAKVGESLAKAYIADGKLSKDEIEGAFNDTKKK